MLLSQASATFSALGDVSQKIEYAVGGFKFVL
jgi:hypothetical protein